MQSARPFLALAILALLVPTHVSGAQENPTDPAAILRRAADALRQVQAVTYTAEHTIRAEGTWPSVRGHVTVARARTGDNALFRHQHFVLDAQVRMLDGHVDSVFATYDGTRLLLRDDTAKVVYEAATPFAAGQLLSEASPILSVASVFTTPEPFERDLTRPLRYVGREVVAGVPVHVVEVQVESPTPDGRTRRSLSTWYLGEQDYLPRRHRFNSLEATITALTVNPPVTAETFRMRAPDTYPYQRVTQRQPRTAGQGVGLLASGTAAPDFTLTDQYGRTHRLSDYRGKVVVLDFWATWCQPCQKAMPDVQALHDRLRERDVVVLGIDAFEETPPDLAALMHNRGLTYPMLGDGSSTAEAYRVVQLPAVYVIGTRGEIVRAESGFAPDMRERITRLITDYLSRPRS